MPSVATQTPRAMLNKVPAVTLIFWVIKILSTTVGETGADLLPDRGGTHQQPPLQGRDIERLGPVLGRELGSAHQGGKLTDIARQNEYYASAKDSCPINPKSL